MKLVMMVMSVKMLIVRIFHRKAIWELLDSSSGSDCSFADVTDELEMGRCSD